MNAETGCATCDGTPTPCEHHWHSAGRFDASGSLAAYRCCRCEAETYPAPVEQVPGYRDEWATPPSEAFRRTDGEMG